MKKITLKEKVRLTSGQGNWHLFESDNLRGRPIYVADGPHGVRVYGQPAENGDFSNQAGLIATTLFPCAAAIASTWNTDLIKQVGQTIGKECRYHQVDVLLGPGINLKRSPLGGRNFEYYSEDPYLTSAIGRAFVQGVQSEQVGACIKHFALNEQETMRRFVDVHIDERTLHELYLYPFYKIIKQANPWMVMSSYNQINGTYASESADLLQTVLRKQWQYEGAVISDWGAVQDKVKSLKNGMNIEMPGPSSFEQDTLDALKMGTLSETELDASLAPVFALHKRVQTIEPCDAIDLDAHHTVAQQVAREAIVLLENDGILPLKHTTQTIGMIGQFAKHPRINGGGSATVRPHHQEVPYESFATKFNSLLYADGYDDNDTNKVLINDAVNVAKKSDVVLFFTGTTEALETEGQDRPHMMLPQGHLDVFEAIRTVNPNMIVILSNGSALDLRTIKAHSRAILETWFLGGAAGEALLDIIVGEASPSGRLQETFPLMLEQTPHYGTFPPLEKVDYHQDLIMHGYRYYDTHQYDVLYPFGYGLSYVDIVYRDVTFDYDETNPSAIMHITVTLENKSKIDAFETVQVYVRTQIAHLIKPAQELRAFKKVRVKAHEKTTVTLHLPLAAFETYCVSAHDFVIYNGTYTVHVARHSRDYIASKTITLTNQTPYAPVMTLAHPVKFLEWFYPDWFSVLESHFRPLRWYEKEEPIARILKRIKKHQSLSDAAYETIKNQIKQAINAD